MLVKEIMNTNVDVINFNKPVLEAAEMMARGNYGCLPVEMNDKMIGMITDRDITLRLVAENKNPKNTKIQECMSNGIEYCFENDNVNDLAEKMSNSKHRRFPVVDENKKLVGIVSLRELVTKARNKDLTQSTFEHICY